MTTPPISPKANPANTKKSWREYVGLLQTKAKDKVAENVVAGAFAIITTIFARYVWQLPGLIQALMFVCVVAAVLGIVALLRKSLMKPSRADEVKHILKGIEEGGRKLLARHSYPTPQNLLPWLREVESALHHIRGKKNEVFYNEFIAGLHQQPAEETWIRAMTWLTTLIPTITDESLSLD